MHSEAGKGSKRRPVHVSDSQFSANWDAIFNKCTNYLQCVKEAMRCEPLLYKNEVLKILEDCNVPEHLVLSVKHTDMNRWYPSEVIEVLTR